MALTSWILGCVWYLGSFLPLIIRRRIQDWKRRADHLVSSLEKSDLLETLSDVTAELHVASRRLYVSVEKSCRRHSITAFLWDRYFKFPLNLAIEKLKSFAEVLLSRAESSHSTDADPKVDMEGLVQAVTSIKQGVHRLSRGIRDLSSEIKLLGDFPAAQGVMSSIWLGELGDTSKVAVKLFIPHRTAAMKKEFIREARVWFRASYHENVLPLLGIAQLRGTLALVSHWMPERDLGVYLATHPDANRLDLLADVARGLAALHSCGIVYGNIRLSTVVVSSAGRAYLSSFLLAHSQDDDEVLRSTLNLNILSPEFLSLEHGRPHTEQETTSTCQSDVFMYGMFAMEVLTANTPYMRRRATIIKAVLRGRRPDRPRAPDNLGLTDHIWALLNHCWSLEPGQRPPMSEVARKAVQLSEDFIPVSSSAMRSIDLWRTPRDISAEIKKLGEYPIAGGGYCDLYLGERLGSEKVALKLVRLIGSTVQDKDAVRRRFFNEARLWAEFKHPRILEFYGICEYGTMSLYMAVKVSPWLENGNIQNYLSNINPAADRHRLLQETAEGLLYLHNCKPPVVHGDLKASNILITETGTAVLADFGLSKFSHEATVTLLQGAGSPRWMAPEIVLTGSELTATGPVKTLKSDVYAYGHVMLEVLSDKKPFFHLKEDLHVIVEIMHGRRSPRPGGPVADKWLDDTSWTISRWCTAINPEDRPDMGPLLAELQREQIAGNE